MFPFFILLANPVTSLSGMNGSPNPLTLPGSGTMVFPLPGSFPWAAGARGKMVPVFESFFLDFRHSIIWKVIPTDIKISVSKPVTINCPNIGASTKRFCKQMFDFDTLDSNK